MKVLTTFPSILVSLVPGFIARKGRGRARFLVGDEGLRVHAPRRQRVPAHTQLVSPHTVHAHKQFVNPPTANDSSVSVSISISVSGFGLSFLVVNFGVGGLQVSLSGFEGERVHAPRRQRVPAPAHFVNRIHTLLLLLLYSRYRS